MKKDLENHVAGSSAQSASHSSTASPDADLHLWRVEDWGGVRVVIGAIFGDKKNRFADGDSIQTSPIVKTAGEMLHTKNSIYRLIPRETTLALIAAGIAAKANEERGVSDSTPQKEQRGSPNPSGAA